MLKDEIISWAEHYFYNQYGPVGTTCPPMVKRAFDNIILRRGND